MLSLSELKVIENAFFRSDLTYNKSSLYPFFEKQFSEEVIFKDKSEGKIDRIISGANDNLAHNVFLSRDLESIKKNIKKKDCTFNEKNWIKLLPEIHKRIERHLGLKFTPRNIVFCDSFPQENKNMELRGASTITIFEGNKNAGIYFLKKRVDNTSTAIHIIHEQIHTCLSQNKDKDQTFIEWFEEGITIMYSLLIYYELTQDIETLRAYRTRSYIFSKTKPEWDFTKRYFEYMKIMSRIFLHGGKNLVKKLLADYLKKKRENINKFLGRIQEDKLPMKHLPKGDIENFIAAFANILEPEKITPLEYAITEKLKNNPKTIEDIAKEIKAPIDVTKNALGRLFGKGICIAVKDNKIDIIWRKKDLFSQGLIKPTYPLSS